MRSIFKIILSVAIGLALPAAASAGQVKKPGMAPELYCLALNIYFEARGEPSVGKVAVGHVVLNRSADRRFPKNLCSVIQQGGYKKRHRCQFSWWCDGRSDRPRDRRAWRESIQVAQLIKQGVLNDPTGGSLWYHATSVKPHWAKHFNRYAKIGRHIFYTDPRKTPQQVADASAAR